MDRAYLPGSHGIARQHFTEHFDGATYEPAKDQKRLGLQLGDVFALMADGKFRTLAEIEDATGHPQSSVSARLRDLRKPRFGGHKVERTRSASLSGLWFYRVVLTDPRENALQQMADEAQKLGLGY